MTLPTGLVVLPGEGDHLQGVEVRNTVKVSHDATGGVFAAFEETTMPGMGPPVHVHTVQWEYFRVLEGEFEFLIGEHRYRAPAGSVAVVPPNTRHGFRNIAAGDSTLEFLITPANKVDEYFRRLTQMLDSINVAPPLADEPDIRP